MGLDNYQLRLIMYNKYEFCDHRQATATCMHITHRHLTATTARHCGLCISSYTMEGERDISALAPKLEGDYTHLVVSPFPGIFHNQ